MPLFFRLMFGVGTSLVSALMIAVTPSAPGFSQESLRYGSTHSTLGTSGVALENDICTMSWRTPYDMGIVKMQDVHPQFQDWAVSDEAYWSVVSAVDCWTTDSITAIPVDLTGHIISIFGSYQIPTEQGLRVFATVRWEDTETQYDDFQVWEFSLEQGGDSYTIEGFRQDTPFEIIRSLANEGWGASQLREFALTVMPQAHTLAGVDNIDNAELQAAVEAIYAVDEHAVSDEEVTDVIYVNDDEVQAIIKVSSVSGDWTLAVNLTHGLLNFTYLGDDSQVGRVAQSLNVTLAQAQAYLTAAGF